MMRGSGLSSPGRWKVIFWTAFLSLGCALGLLAWRLAQQDLELAAQRLSTQREAAADLAVAAIGGKLTEVERALAGLPSASPPPGEALYLFIRGVELRVWPEGRLLYRPDAVPALEPESPVLAQADAAEFRASDFARAIALLEPLASTPDMRLRAAVLVRLARNHRKSGDLAQALRAYERLYECGAAPVGGMPAALAARSGALAARNDKPAAEALGRELLSGRWPIDSATFDNLLQQARSASGQPLAVPTARLTLSEAVDHLWTNRGDQPAEGRAWMEFKSGPALVVWRRTAGSLAAYVAPDAVVRQEWLGALTPILAQYGVGVSLDPRSTGRPAVRLASATRLPWTVQVFNQPDSAQETRERARRLMIGASSALLLLLLLLAGWTIGRTVTRELALVRLQSDFVSAVSHEFRTPLTTLRQLSEMLRTDRVAGDEDRRQYYELLSQESERLHRLVEGLLTYGRLEAGKVEFHFETLEAAGFVRDIVDDFQRQPQARGYAFEVDAAPATVRAARESLKCAIWNLLENAVKYSPDCRTVWIGVAPRNGRVILSVRDRGVGIPPDEQRRIFDRFFRGAEARERNLRGTGVGLATVRQIVLAHGGKIEVRSEPGEGSTFTVILERVDGQ
jgi:signal transduction histidine kinase